MTDDDIEQVLRIAKMAVEDKDFRHAIVLGEAIAMTAQAIADDEANIERLRKQHTLLLRMKKEEGERWCERFMGKEHKSI